MTSPVQKEGLPLHGMFVMKILNVDIVGWEGVLRTEKERVMKIDQIWSAWKLIRLRISAWKKGKRKEFCS